jgi:hypothetical protein
LLLLSISSNSLSIQQDSKQPLSQQSTRKLSTSSQATCQQRLSSS